jgi:hypothetical protein
MMVHRALRGRLLIPLLFAGAMLGGGSGCNSSEILLGAHRVEQEETGGSAGAPALPEEPPEPVEPVWCEITEPPSSLALPSFYAMYANAAGIPVLASEEIDPQALTMACWAALGMLAKRPDVHDQMIESSARIAVIGQNQLIRDLPGFEFVPESSEQTRSHGPRPGHPWIGVSEENLLCLNDDRFFGESLMVHAFAHGMRLLGIEPLEPEFVERLSSAYEAAIAAGKWQNTFAAGSRERYFAEGVQSWFDANQYASPPDGVHNEIATHDALRDYDEGLYLLIEEYLPRERAFSFCP